MRARPPISKRSWNVRGLTVCEASGSSFGISPGVTAAVRVSIQLTFPGNEVAIFDDAGGVAALRQKSRVLTGYFDFLLRERAPRDVSVITPADVESRGCQLSLRVAGDAGDRQRDLAERGFWLDKREPDILRAAPVPLYNTFDEVWRLVDALAAE